MDRPYLDANVLFSAALAPEAALERLWSVKNARLITSPYAIEEARDNLTRFAAPALRRLDRLLGRILIAPDRLEGDLPPGVVLPDKDKPILLAAIAAGASHLLTSDRKHFQKYLGRTFAGVKLQLAGQYLREKTGR